MRGGAEATRRARFTQKASTWDEHVGTGPGPRVRSAWAWASCPRGGRRRAAPSGCGVRGGTRGPESSSRRATVGVRAGAAAPRGAAGCPLSPGAAQAGSRRWSPASQADTWSCLWEGRQRPRTFLPASIVAKWLRTLKGTRTPGWGRTGRTHAHTYACMHVCTCTQRHARRRTRTGTCTHTHAHTHTDTHVRIRAHTDALTQTRTCVHSIIMSDSTPCGNQ